MAKVTLSIQLDLPALSNDMDNSAVLAHVANAVFFVYEADDKQDDLLPLKILEVKSPKGEVIFTAKDEYTGDS